MEAMLLEVGMAKKRGRPKTSTGEGPPVRIEADLSTMAKYVASHRGVPVSKLVSDLLRPALEREFGKVAPKLSQGSDQAGDEA